MEGHLKRGVKNNSHFFHVKWALFFLESLQKTSKTKCCRTPLSAPKSYIDQRRAFKNLYYPSSFFFFHLIKVRIRVPLNSDLGNLIKCIIFTWLLLIASRRLTNNIPKEKKNMRKVSPRVVLEFKKTTKKRKPIL